MLSSPRLSLATPWSWDETVTLPLSRRELKVRSQAQSEAGLQVVGVRVPRDPPLTPPLFWPDPRLPAETPPGVPGRLGRVRVPSGGRFSAPWSPLSWSASSLQTLCLVSGVGFGRGAPHSSKGRTPETSSPLAPLTPSPPHSSLVL